MYRHWRAGCGESRTSGSEGGRRKSAPVHGVTRRRPTLPSDATTLRYYRSTDSIISSTDTSVGTDSVGGLAASGSSAESIDLTAPSTSGTYYYGACVDSVSGESDTTNNCSVGLAVTVGGETETAPDLVMYVVVMVSSPYGGLDFHLEATVRNQGSGPSDATTLRYYRSTDSIITTGDTQVGTDSVGGLAASGSSRESIDLTAPSTPGTQYYGACVDSVSDESDTTNNCSGGLAFTVRAAPSSTDATLSGLTLSGVNFGTFASGTNSYTASVANSVSQTTVTPTVNHSGASYVIKLGGVTDADGTVALSVGSNVITVEVTAEDGETTRTYTIDVTVVATDSKQSLKSRYDANKDRVISRDEVITAIDDYLFDGLITRDEVLEIIELYLFS